MNREMIDHWGAVAEKHAAVMECLAWLQEKYDIRLDWDFAPEGTPLDLNLLVDQFFEVDRGLLERERRELLERFHAESATQSESAENYGVEEIAATEICRCPECDNLTTRSAISAEHRQPKAVSRNPPKCN